MTRQREPVGLLLARARRLRAERDRYLREAPEILRALRAHEVTYEEIATRTGIPPGTAARLSGTSASTSSAAAP